MAAPGGRARRRAGDFPFPSDGSRREEMVAVVGTDIRLSMEGNRSLEKAGQGCRRWETWMAVVGRPGILRWLIWYCAWNSVM